MLWPILIARLRPRSGGCGTQVQGVLYFRAATLAEYQGQGVGSRLIRAGLNACREAAYDGLVVLGEPDYYCRFGYERASGRGSGSEYGVDLTSWSWS